MSPPFRFPIHRPMIRACAMLAATAAATVGAAEERTTTATDRGVEVAADVWCPLPVAVLRLDAVQTPADLRPLAGVAGWERFTADGVTAPVTVTIEPFAVGGIRLAHRVHSAFTLRAPLARLRADETLRKSLGTTDDEADAGRPLTPEELREAGIEADERSGERFVWVEVPLLNRVTIRGVVRTVTTERPDGIEVAWRFDPRFDAHPRWRATWTRLEENPLGERVEGEPRPYRGSGGVVAVRTLEATEGLDLLLVESRMVLVEPEEWFQGSNLLRSKIPLTAQEGVRTLRRRLAATR